MKSRAPRTFWSPQQISSSVCCGRTWLRGVTYSTMRWTVSPATHEFKYFRMDGCLSVFNLCEKEKTSINAQKLETV
jgi:hypothetical protein